MGWLAAIGFLILPLGGVLVAGLSSPTQGWDWVWISHVIRFTYGQAFLSALGSAVVGCIGAWIYSEWRFPGREWLWRLSLLGFSLPPILVVLGFSSVLGEGASLFGLSPRVWLGWPGILIAHIFYNFPLFLRLVGSAMIGRNREPEMAALSLGATRWGTFFRVTVWQLRPAFLSAFFLAFLYCAASFLIVLFLGGGPRFTTLEVAIYQAVKVEFDLAMASRLALIQMGVALAVYLVFLRKGVVFGTQRISGPSLFPPTKKWIPLVWVYLGCVAALIGAPILSLFVASLPGWASLDWVGLGGSLVRSLFLAFLAGLQVASYALGLAYCVHHGSRLWSKGLGVVAVAPLALSSLVLSLSWVLLAPGWLGGFRGNLVFASMIQAIIALPLAYRPVRDSLGQVPPELVQSSRLLGATPWRTLLRVEAPLCLPALRLAFVLGAGFSLGEVGAVVLFLEEGMETLPLLIFRLMGRYQFSEAYAVGVILVMVMAGLYRGGVRNERSTGE